MCLQCEAEACISVLGCKWAHQMASVVVPNRMHCSFLRCCPRLPLRSDAANVNICPSGITRWQVLALALLACETSLGMLFVRSCMAGSSSDCEIRGESFTISMVPVINKLVVLVHITWHSPKSKESYACLKHQSPHSCCLLELAIGRVLHWRGAVCGCQSCCSDTQAAQTWDRQTDLWYLQPVSKFVLRNRPWS